MVTRYWPFVCLQEFWGWSPTCIRGLRRRTKSPSKSRPRVPSPEIHSLLTSQARTGPHWRGTHPETIQQNSYHVQRSVHIPTPFSVYTSSCTRSNMTDDIQEPSREVWAASFSWLTREIHELWILILNCWFDSGPTAVLAVFWVIVLLVY